MLLVANASATPQAWPVDPEVEEQSLAGALLVIPDGGRELNIDAVAAGEYDAEAMTFKRLPPNLGYPHHAYWVRMRLNNPSAQALERLLVLWRGASQAQTIRIEGDVRRNVRFGRGADRVGDVLSRHQVLRLTLPSRVTLAITARIESRVALVLDYRLLTAAAMAGHDVVDYASFGVLLGAVFSIGVFVLAIWFGMRERIFLWFAGFALGILVYHLHAEGYAYMFAPAWQVPGSYLAAYVGAVQSICLLLLVREYLVASGAAPRLDRFVVAPLLVVQLLVFPLFPIRPWLGNTVVALTVILSCLAMAALLLLSLWRGTLRMRTFFFALLLQLLATAAFLLKRAGALPDLTLLTIAIHLTTMLSVLMFAIAISRRVRAVANENRKIQERYAQRLELDVAERTHQYREATERAEQALEHLQQAQQQLVEQEKMASLGSLVAGVAHEVNTPLGVALTASSHLGLKSSEVAEQFQAGALRKSELQNFIGTAQESSTMIQRNLDRAAHLIQSFKQVSVDRTSDGRRRFEVSGHLHELVESLSLIWKRRPVTLTLDCSESIEMDSFPGALGQVLTNLIQNALLHAFEPEQSGEMRIAVRELGASRIEIVFGDSGKGASSAVIAKIFEPFFTTKRGQGGTGLGLHVCYNLVTQKLGGNIRVENALNSGLRFVLNLPRDAPDAA